MRIVGGSAKGRRLCAIKGFSIRPTSDKVREAVFNILGAEFHYKNVLDLFAGTGAMGIEALSRGAEKVTFIDKDASAIKMVNKNLDICGFADKAKVIKMDVILFLEQKPSAFSLQPKAFDLIFIDPPYAAGLTGMALEMIDKNKILADSGVIVSETSKRAAIDAKLSGLQEFDKRQYGDTVLRFYKNSPHPTPTLTLPRKGGGGEGQGEREKEWNYNKEHQT